MTESLTTPVAFIVFNRPEQTRRVLTAIARARPKTLLIIADGPRGDRAGESERCAATRALFESIDWPCQVLRNFSDANLGCRRRVSTGISWVFDTVEEAIILEDDCLPDPTFFRFCTEILDRFRDDERVMHIGGTNFQDSAVNEDSYYFSHHVHVWGWASWRRAWRHYDADLKEWQRLRLAGRWRDYASDEAQAKQLRRLADRVVAGTLDTWDVQWVLACRLQNGLSIIPESNLVANIGFGPNATHTSDPGHPGAWRPTYPLSFPLRHPTITLPNGLADARTTRLFRPTLYRKFRSGAYRLLNAARMDR